jgi:acetylornithine deacetylase/succinyl-diaminopimelate desuccinylase-like protein
MSQLNTILKDIDGDWIADRAEELVRIPSVTMHEEAVCVVYEQMIRELGLDVDVREVTPGRNNLYARIAGHGEGPVLMLNGHLDTIPNQNKQACYRDGDLLFGRGTTDMKGGMAAILGAVKAILETDTKLQGDLWLTAVVGHEEPEAEKDGPKALIEDINNGRTPCDRIMIVEGPDKLWVMSMGSMVFTIHLDQEGGGRHTNFVPFSENPIRHMSDLIQRILERKEELDSGDVHPLAGPERIDLGIVNAGDYFNRTPQRCTLTGTRRWTPGKTAEGILEDLREMAQPFADAGNLKLSVSMEHQREPFETAADDPLVKATESAHKTVTGTEAEHIGMRIVGDANLYVHGSGVPTIYYGPSNETAHADVENVSIARMKSAAQVYALTAAHYCGVRE